MRTLVLVLTIALFLAGSWLGQLAYAQSVPDGTKPAAAPQATSIPWKGWVNPAPLSKAHAFLADKCESCHTPYKGPDPTACLSCHADNPRLLEMQNTAFHANISTCSGCHVEHQGADRRPINMDHEVLAKAGVTWSNKLSEASPDKTAAAAHDSSPLLADLKAYLAGIEHGKAGGSPEAEVLQCSSCHAKQDPHQNQFGSECATCHSTKVWSIPEFVHPSPNSRDCNQCHQAPPSHYMEHFTMMSQQIARRPDAKVEDCQACHLTNSWNDIAGVGWSKVH
ncbi:cytochrome c3 family protein [Pleomorphomonas oryzae]|uniref:cytochrome c3 family protein n=1 Tax=Pleomorphomonas oryzae TaxID=261934 RepID=UPI00042A2F39|nr:cytochrome c3 family protein [Pleomorphomonas oryzae]